MVDRKTHFDVVKVATFARTASFKAAELAAYDVRQSARRSIKSGGRRRSSKNWATSKPGEPPRYHTGRLKNAIEVARVDLGEYIVGPYKTADSSASKTLEYGGTGAVRETFFADSYVSRRARPKPPPPGLVRPKAKRKYYVYAKNKPRGKLVRDYQYFYSESSWSRASRSARFQSWASTQKTTSTLRVPVAPRPFMAPALERETAASKNASRLRRAASQVK